jgi:hypothetical protein
MWVQGIFISHSSATADKNNAVDAPISKDLILILSMDWYYAPFFFFFDNFMLLVGIF